MLNPHLWELIAPLTASALLCAASTAVADDHQSKLNVPVHAVNEMGPQEAIGHIEITPVEGGGLELRPRLEGLSSGIHGFHIHQNPDCSTAIIDGESTPAGAAGGHLAPHGNSHKAPWEDGHVGDLPALYVTAEGVAKHPVFKPELDLDDIRGHALVIHEGGDTYTDEPTATGGGGARVACGVVNGA